MKIFDFALSDWTERAKPSQALACYEYPRSQIVALLLVLSLSTHGNDDTFLCTWLNFDFVDNNIFVKCLL